MPLDPIEKNNKVDRPRVLVVDDEKKIRRAMGYILDSEFDVTLVESGDRAIETIRKGNEFDVISLDLQMPGKSGIQTLREIKKTWPTAEVLIVTANSDAESAKSALKLGAYDYIDKPFDKNRYRESIRKGVERYRKQLGLEKAEKELSFFKAQLKEADKFSAIGELLAGVVHELNNPLGVILGFSELLLSKEHPPDTTRQYIESINQATQLCHKVVQKLLNLSRKHEPKHEDIQINQVIQNTLDLKQHDLQRNNVELSTQLAEDLPLARGDFHELQQVILNIINNADQAMQEQEGHGGLSIRTEAGGEMIRISIQDTGPGIPEENIENIFEPLFTTKEEGQGTGLGLSVCCEIIQEHRGNIYVASDPRKGACFVIELPEAAALDEEDRDVEV